MVHCLLRIFRCSCQYEGGTGYEISEKVFERDLACDGILKDPKFQLYTKSSISTNFERNQGDRLMITCQPGIVVHFEWIVQ